MDDLDVFKLKKGSDKLSIKLLWNNPYTEEQKNKWLLNKTRTNNLISVSTL